MDINEIRKEKQELEERLLKIVANELKAFALKTGVYIESVDIATQQIGIIGEAVDKIIPIRVACDISI